MWQGTAVLCCALLLASIAQLRHPQFGFTTLLGLYEIGHPGETPALQAIPHFDHPGGHGYDGGYYLHLALDPLLADPATDRALDLPPYRTRRILFSWTAYAAGFAIGHQKPIRCFQILGLRIRKSRDA